MMEQLLDVRPEIAASQPYGLFRDNELSAANSVKTQINRMFFFRMNLRRRIHLLLQSKLEKKRFPDRLLNKIDTVYVDVLRRRRLWPLERIEPREEKHVVLLGQAVHEDLSLDYAWISTTLMRRNFGRSVLGCIEAVPCK